jgi:hypothetical protein
MNKLFVFALALLSVACREEGNTQTNPIDETFDPAQATLLRQGSFVGSGHTVTGTAALYNSDGRIVLLLDPFSTENGPDLKVYLSKDGTVNEFVSLGVLKSTNGKQAYEVKGIINADPYKFALIWCRQFMVLFGKAELE